MFRIALIAGAVLAVAAAPANAGGRHARLDRNGKFDALISKYASMHDVPETLVRRIIRRESGGNPRAVHAGNYGLMQIRLGTARALGYQGGVRGLLDAETNMAYAVKYLAGAYRVANGNADRAVHYYAAGYYYAAKRKGVARHHRARHHSRRSPRFIAATTPTGEDMASGRLDRF